MRATMLLSAFVSILVGAMPSAETQNLDTQNALVHKLESQFALTQPTADNTDIVTAGAILVLEKGNVVMAPVSSTDFYQNTYRDGRITQNAAGKAKGLFGRVGRVPGVSLIPGVGGAAGAAGAATGPEPRTYVRGEKMWVTKIEVKDDDVVFDLFTDPVADVRYKAALKFQFPKGSIPPTDLIEKLVAEVFKIQPAIDANGAGNAPGAAPPGAQRTAEPAPEPVVPSADEPPAAPQTISIGQTKDQVVASFGQPEKVIKLGMKEMYIYKDLKVTFVSGKVADVR